jgi:hypothetical protein
MTTTSSVQDMTATELAKTIMRMLPDGTSENVYTYLGVMQERSWMEGWRKGYDDAKENYA